MNPIETVLKTTMGELKEMVDVNTVVGEPFVTPDGSTIIPISKVCFGFVTGGGEYSCGKQPEIEKPFAGGSASGVGITPVAFMVANKDGCKLLCMAHRGTLDKVLEHTPAVLCELKNMFKECGAEKQNKSGAKNKNKESSDEENKNSEA